VAISENQGHSFGWHVAASRDVDIGRKPDIALAGDQLAVSWMTAGGGGGDSAATRIVRQGRIR
jgi:hypothetical protein